MSKEKEIDKIIKDKLQQHASPLPTHLWEGIDAILGEDKVGETDKVIKDKLHMHASPTSTHLWEGIDARLDDDKGKKRGFIWWWTGGAALLLLLGAAWYFTMAQSDNVNQQTTSEPIATQEKRIDSSPKTELQKTNLVQADADLASANESSVLNQEETAKMLSPKTTLSPRKTIIKQEAQTTIVEQSASIVVDERSESKTSEVLTKVDEIEKVEAPIVDASSDLSENKNAFVGLQLAPKSLMFDQSDLDLNKFLNEDPECTCLSSKALGKKDPKCARFGKWLKLYFYVDAYVSPDIAFRTLSPKDAASYDYSQTRDATETSGISFSTGARFSVVSNFGWAARTGIVYSQINERFDYQSENEKRVTTKDILDVNGNIIGQDTLIEFGARFTTTYNHYRMIDIPLIIGYEMNVKKMVLTLNSGVYFNLMSRQQGKFLSPDNKLVSFSSEDPGSYPAFKNHLNLSIYGSIGALYNLNEHWQIMLEPHLRYYVDPLTKRDYMVEQKYFSTGLITGLRYKF